MKFGTHNLYDYAGTPTPFADIIVFTEAIPARVKDHLEPKGYKVVVCRAQKDLCIAYKKGGPFKRTLRPTGYRKIVDGIAKVTPHRGTFWVHGNYNGKPAVIIAEHRINAAFPPFVRGEDVFRKSMWVKHTAFTLTLIKRFKDAGKIILAGGDLNTPRGVKGYSGRLVERGGHFDRLGFHGVEAGPVEVLDYKAGSDHPRIRAKIS